MLQASYVLPLRRHQPEQGDELAGYLRWLATHVEEVIVVDGSPPGVYTAHAARWAALTRHIPPDPARRTLNGKVHGVLTGLHAASHERVVLADDDVRYDLDGLRRVITLLATQDVVRPQNYFTPLPWHVQWDTARTLLNRISGGDWPGTLGVRRSTLLAVGGYDGDVLFENLELVRTVLAAGGTMVTPLDLFVRRRPPTARHFWSQRVRQAYDEFARPARLCLWLACLPLVLWLAAGKRWRTVLAGAAALVGLAELGRRRGNGQRIFPASATLFAPLWVMERAICTWLALGARLFLGGVPYHGRRLTRAATPRRTLSRRLSHARGTHLASITRKKSYLAEREKEGR